MIAQTSSAFDIVKVGFERFIAGSAADQGLFYDLATAAMAIMTGWFASVVFRKD
jgi:Putative transmembrane protein (Alph_Pro_TM)